MTDIVERLRMDPYKEQFQFEREARITLSKILAEAADEIERLNKYRSLVLFINEDYHELSYEKARWQRDDWKKRANKLIEEDQ